MVELFAIWFLLVGFVVWTAVHKIWYSLHWMTKVLLAVFWLAWPLDVLINFTLCTLYFWEFPRQWTVSERMHWHRYDSRLACFVWKEIRKIDPTHLGGN